ncbi:MAG: class I SAM-dependent methyltransferase [Actinomycetota bacterium]
MRKLVALGAVAVGAVALWWRKNPSACPYGQRFWVEAPHPLITRARLCEILEPQPGERLLEIGPGTGYYTLELAAWVSDQGAIEVLDIQQEMLDHTIRAARERGLWNVNPTRGDAQELGWDDDSFDAAILITVLGEIPDQDAALREIARVLRPGGRLIVGELFGDPHMVTLGSLQRRAEAAGLRFERRVGPKVGYFARFSA